MPERVSREEFGAETCAVLMTMVKALVDVPEQVTVRDRTEAW